MIKHSITRTKLQSGITNAFLKTCKHPFLFTRKHTFVFGYAEQLHGRPPWEGGWDTGVGRSSSIQPNSEILIENSLVGKTCQKNDSTKLIFKNLQTYIFIYESDLSL